MSGGHYELSCMNDINLIISIHHIQGKNTFDFKYTRENELSFSYLAKESESNFVRENERDCPLN